MSSHAFNQKTQKKGPSKWLGHSQISHIDFVNSPTCQA